MNSWNALDMGFYTGEPAEKVAVMLCKETVDPFLKFSRIFPLRIIFSEKEACVGSVGSTSHLLIATKLFLWRSYSC